MSPSSDVADDSLTERASRVNCGIRFRTDAATEVRIEPGLLPSQPALDGLRAL